MDRLEVLQQKLEHWCASSVRALANVPSAHYRGHHLFIKDQPLLIHAPYLHLDFETHDTTKLRGVADSIALRLLYSDSELHQTLKPKSTIQQLVFEILEQLRTDSLMPECLPGMRSNLRARFLFWAHQALSSKLVENDIGLLLYTVTVVCWSRLLKQPIPEQIEDLIEGTRWGFPDELKHHLYRFSKVRDDQAGFAEHALAIALEVDHMIDEASEGGSDESQSETQALKSFIKTQQFALQWLETDAATLQQSLGVSRAQEIDNLDAAYQYRVYNKAHDIEVQAVNTIRHAQLLKFRAQLDKRSRQQSINTHRVARYLTQLIASPTPSGWAFGKEQGHLDSARLTRLVTSPNERRLFRQENQSAQADCVVSLVLDNSGSMTHHNELIAVFVDTFVKALELAGIKTEVLGFTTVDWNGGKVAKEWAAAGKPEKPGRLTSVCHTIYKAAETPWRRSRSAIAGMLKSELFREGIDGEALEWAVKRIETRPEKKKIVVMLSDGSPMDTATVAANSERYLDHHLAQVALAVEKRPDIQLCALGVGLDLSAYYRESMSISLHDEMVTKDYFAIADLLHRAV